MSAAVVVQRLTSGSESERLLDQVRDRTDLAAVASEHEWIFTDPNADDSWTVEDRVIDALNWLSATWPIHLRVERPSER